MVLSFIIYLLLMLVRRRESCLLMKSLDPVNQTILEQWLTNASIDWDSGIVAKPAVIDFPRIGPDMLRTTSSDGFTSKASARSRRHRAVRVGSVSQLLAPHFHFRSNYQIELSNLFMHVSIFLVRVRVHSA